MRARFDLKAIFALATLLIAGYALYSSLDWPSRTALFPRVIAIPIFLLALIETVLCLIGFEEERKGHAVDFELTTDVDPSTAQRRTLATGTWIVGFFGLILFVGFPLAVPVFVFAYLKLAGREGWLLTTVLTATSWLFMEGLFNRLLHIPFAEGWIFSLFGAT